MAIALPITACNVTGSAPPPPPSGHIVADEPQAALAGREALLAGGNAADAAAAAALTMAVTLPSRVGLLGGGVCLAYDPVTKAVRTLDFLPRSGSGGVALPGLLRGLYALQGTYGKLRWEKLTALAENTARDGAPLSRALAQDLREAAPTLAQDPQARQVWLAGGTTAPAEGTRLAQPDLAQLLSQVRRQGVAAVHGGALAGTLASGIGASAEALRGWQPAWRDALQLESGVDALHVAGFDGDGSAGWRAAAAARGGDRLSRLAEALGRAPAAHPPAVPGATVAVIDSGDYAVACTLTMGGPFGTGRMVPGTGLFAARPTEAAGVGGPALLVNHNVGSVRFAGAAATDRLSHIACTLDDHQHKRCQGAADPRGGGLVTRADR